MEDWDLHAVVRGCRGGGSGGGAASPATPPAATPAAMEMESFAFFSQALLQEEDDDDDSLLCFPDLLATQACMQELEELCRPFYPKTPQPISPESHPIPFKDQQQQLLLLQKQKSSSNPQISRSKRRKNQEKRVVCEVPAEGLSSDMWAWRKYGQKPIKGSPYPRGYYRCSSSKGCLARKQVERSRSNPAMFVITYTAEHNHPLPTHRNSLAGSTRSKPSPSPSCVPPANPLSASGEEDRTDQAAVNVPADDEMAAAQTSDDVFLDLEELRDSSSTSGSFDGCLSDNYAASSSPWTDSFFAPATTLMP